VTEEQEDAESLLVATPPPASTDDGELCPCEKAHKESGNKKKVLYMMSIVLQCNDVPLFSFETVQWLLLPKTSLHPKNTDYGKKIARQAKLFNISQHLVQVIGLDSKQLSGSNKTQFATMQTFLSSLRK
jgi:hypothetical protein